MKLILLIIGIFLGWAICSLPLALIVGKLLKRARKRAEREEIKFLLGGMGIFWQSDLGRITSKEECYKIISKIISSIENLRPKQIKLD